MPARRGLARCLRHYDPDYALAHACTVRRSAANAKDSRVRNVRAARVRPERRGIAFPTTVAASGCWPALTLAGAGTRWNDEVAVIARARQTTAEGAPAAPRARRRSQEARPGPGRRPTHQVRHRAGCRGPGRHGRAGGTAVDPAHPAVPPALARARQSPRSVTGWACWPPRSSPRQPGQRLHRQGCGVRRGDRGPAAAGSDPRPDRRRLRRPVRPPVHDGRLRPRPVRCCSPRSRSSRCSRRTRRLVRGLDGGRHVHHRDDHDGLGAGQGRLGAEPAAQGAAGVGQPAHPGHDVRRHAGRPRPCCWPD